LRLRDILDAMDVETRFVSAPVLEIAHEYASREADLIILELDGAGVRDLRDIEEKLFSEGSATLFLIINAADISRLQLSSRLTIDFATHEAADAELAIRIKRLLWPGEESAGGDFVRLGALTLNLATYQVKVDGIVLDLTYLEYALLAFLVTHPGKTYSRDALLHRVWGFDYFGGSRTVDVHVRRIRAKLGPELAQHLETVRGVGYLWSY
jgi:DNA-binding response OmpR family regulator